jgi:hypothetical protein
VTSKFGLKAKSVSKRELVAVKRKYDDARYNYVSSGDFAPPAVDDIVT